jgi:hypothetical protein
MEKPIQNNPINFLKHILLKRELSELEVYLSMFQSNINIFRDTIYNTNRILWCSWII